MRNKEKPLVFKYREKRGDMTAKVEVGITVTGVIEPFKAFATATADFKTSVVNTALLVKRVQCLAPVQSFIPLYKPQKLRL